MKGYPQHSGISGVQAEKDLAKEITIQPVRRFDLAAAIIFSDILMIPYGLGQAVKFKKGHGPLLDELKLDNERPPPSVAPKKASAEPSKL